METIEQTQVEQVSVDEHSFSVDTDGPVSVEAEGLHSSLSEMADSFDVTGFKCVKCNLTHMHDTLKHRLSDDFDISDEDAADQNYNPVCHCGVQEAGRRGDDMGIDQDKASGIAEQAPIPPETSREMDDELGAL